MTHLKVLGESSADSAEAQAKMKLPLFRKSTLNMAMAAAAVEKLFADKKLDKSVDKTTVALVLTTESGELETTVEFLKTLDQSKIARPLLFQNSLHNATAGFLSIHFGITGPVLTVGIDDRQMKSGLELAETLLLSQQCKHALVISVNVWAHVSDDAPSSKTLPEGARCLLVSL